MKKYNIFDVVRIQIIHDYVFFKYSKNRSIFEEAMGQDDWKTIFVKSRPAIIIRRFEPRRKTNGEWRYLVIPTTSQRSVENWKGTRTSLRIKLHNPELNKTNYLMLDKMLTLTENQIIGVYKKGGILFSITEDQRKWLSTEIEYRLGHIIRPFTADEAREIALEEELINKSW